MSVNICVQMCVHARMHARARARTRARTHTHTHTHTSVCVSCVCTCVHVHMCTLMFLLSQHLDHGLRTCSGHKGGTPHPPTFRATQNASPGPSLTLTGGSAPLPLAVPQLGMQMPPLFLVLWLISVSICLFFASGLRADLCFWMLHILHIDPHLQRLAQPAHRPPFCETH